MNLNFPPSGFKLPPYDYIAATPNFTTPTTLVFKVGGSGGVTVATLTFTYSAGSLVGISRS